MSRCLSCRGQLILVGGETGSGKSTFARLLSQRLGSCVVVEGDPLMKEAFCEKKGELLEGTDGIKYGRDGHIKARSFYMRRDDFNKALAVILPYMGKRISEELEWNNKDDYIIVEWSHIHLIPVWKRAEWRFFVQASDSVKMSRLLSRDREGHRDDPAESRKRIQAKLLTGKVTGLGDDVIIVDNHGSLEDLSHMAEKYAAVIKRKRKFLFLTGQHGCGKTFISRRLLDKRGDCFLFDCGPEMRKLYEECGGSGKLGDWIRESNKKNGELFTEKQVVTRMKERLLYSECTNGVIVGVRSMEHVRLFCADLGISRARIAYMECGSEQRRLHLEKRLGHPISEETLKKMDQHDQGMGLGNILEYVRNNPDTCRILYIDGMDSTDIVGEISDAIDE